MRTNLASCSTNQGSYSPEGRPSEKTSTAHLTARDRQLLSDIRFYTGTASVRKQTPMGTGNGVFEFVSTTQTC